MQEPQRGKRAPGAGQFGAFNGPDMVARRWLPGSPQEILVGAYLLLTRVEWFSRRAKSVFAKLKIDYQWIDITDDAGARAYVEKVNRGNRSVPTIVFPDGTVLVEPSNADLEKKLKSMT